MHAPIVFVTDFGSDDTYAAALAAACWRVDPTLTALAGMHGVPPGDVLAGAYHVKAIAQALPPGGVVCAVVDPAVGTARQAIAAECGGVRFVGPDNGLISWLWAEAELSGRRSVALAAPSNASATFHGRDMFAPAAARLATGASLAELGNAEVRPLLRDDAFVRDGHGVVCAVDHFGNAITTLRHADLRGRAVYEVEWRGGRTTRVVRTYADIPDGEIAVVVGSAGHLEIAARGQPATALGAPPRGAAVRLTLQP